MKWQKPREQQKLISVKRVKAEKGFIQRIKPVGILTAKIIKRLIRGKVGEVRLEDAQFGQAGFQLYF